MAKCKACGGSGKIEEKDSKLPMAPDDSKHEQNIARKKTKERHTAIKPKERKSPNIRKDEHKQNIGSKPKNYKPIKGYRTKAK